ncbi:MAG: SAM-dependent methyltransferase [Proteobacteria bacterium]|nr:SAM-dependent methyltransferase [Pseudomonadota bacterium]
MKAATGRLLLVPNALDHGAEPLPITELLPHGVLQQAAALAHWVVEDARSARALLKRVQAVVPLALPLQAIDIRELPRPPKGGAAARAPAPDWRGLLAPALAGRDLGLLSEAGLPGVADPGAALVAAAHAAGVPVLPLPGASAIVLALAASGLDGQSFAFVGYLPQEPAARAARIRELQTASRRLGQTQLMIETPYRNAALLRALLDTLDAGTRLSVSCGLTLPAGFTRSATVAAWRVAPQTLPDRLPAVFALLA